MFWWALTLGIFVALAAAMYVPDWIRWAKWNRRRKRATPGEARDMRPPVRPPFWSSYSGLGATWGGFGAGGYDGGFDGGGSDGGGFDGGGGDGGGDGGC
ncbi:MAG TPA: hypothetical protein VHN37_13345 [Actinomycetota bacterium]|nr:hypothetical protein [Actinomycetota bacterium]